MSLSAVNYPSRPRSFKREKNPHGKRNKRRNDDEKVRIVYKNKSEKIIDNSEFDDNDDSFNRLSTKLVLKYKIIDNKCAEEIMTWESHILNIIYNIPDVDRRIAILAGIVKKYIPRKDVKTFDVNEFDQLMYEWVTKKLSSLHSNINISNGSDNNSDSDEDSTHIRLEDVFNHGGIKISNEDKQCFDLFEQTVSEMLITEFDNERTQKENNNSKNNSFNDLYTDQMAISNKIDFIIKSYTLEFNKTSTVSNDKKFSLSKNEFNKYLQKWIKQLRTDYDIKNYLPVGFNF